MDGIDAAEHDLRRAGRDQDRRLPPVVLAPAVALEHIGLAEAVAANQGRIAAQGHVAPEGVVQLRIGRRNPFEFDPGSREDVLPMQDMYGSTAEVVTVRADDRGVAVNRHGSTKVSIHGLGRAVGGGD